MEELKGLTDEFDRFKRIVSFVRSQKQNFPGITIPQNALDKDIQYFLNKQKPCGGTNAQDYTDVLQLSTGD